MAALALARESVRPAEEAL